MREAPRHSLAFAALVALAGCSSSPGLLDGATLALRGHHEVEPAADGSLLPRVIGREATPGLCIDVRPEVDTSRWEGRVYLATEPGSAEYRAPAARLGTVLCFDTSAPLKDEDGERSLCLDVRDAYDGRTAEGTCVRLRFEADDRRHAELRAEIPAVLSSGSDPGAKAAQLEELASTAWDAGYPLLDMRAISIASWLLRRKGTPDALDHASALLDSFPPWIDAPEASGLAAQVAYERAMIAVASGFELGQAWSELRVAERRYRRVLDPKLFTVAMKQAEILSRVGASAEGRERLRTALARCGDLACDERLLPAAQNTLAWLILEDPDAMSSDLAEAEALLDAVLSHPSSSSDPVERANVLVNLGYTRARRGEDPAGAVAAARTLLGSTANAPTKSAVELERWLVFVEATRAEDDGRFEDALALYRTVTLPPSSARLAAWGLGGTARLLRRSGDLDGAARALDRALLLHEYATDESLGQSVALGPSQRADDFYRAARIAVERGDSERAWSVLEQLDGLIAREGVCEVEDDARGTERDAILAELAAIDVPASSARRVQREPIRLELLDRLQELEREAPNCEWLLSYLVPSEPDFRVVALEDEVLLLRRDPTGRVAIYRRTSIDRRELVRSIREMERALASRELDDARWIALVEPLARAIAPDPRDLGPRTSFAAYGPLQAVPIEALPVPTEGENVRWLGGATIVTYRPAGWVTSHCRIYMGGLTGPPGPLFVVDPTGDLATGADMVRFYRATFPDANILEGETAPRDVVRSALYSASSLHVDAHVRYDPAFPELSELRLADGPLLASDLVMPHWSFANLSACRSGSWPVTADSGRFGIAGMLARGGVPWVVATRSDLADDLGRDFNREFYRSIAAGSDVPSAYRDAMAAVRKDYPASSWAALLLLERESEEIRGQSLAARTPLPTTGVSALREGRP